MSWDGLKEVVLKIGRSPLAEKVILRGSFPMRVWFGDAARDPFDVDFIATESWISMGSDEADELVGEVLGLLGTPTWRDFIVDYPYSYGWRLAYPDARIDLAVGEELREPPESIDVDGIRLAVVSKAESFAWKLRWLVAETRKEPKDLYDAVLLAESIRAETGEVHMGLAWELVEEEYPGHWAPTSSWEAHAPSAESWTGEGLPGHPDEWIARLAAACGPWSQDEAAALKAAGEA